MILSAKDSKVEEYFQLDNQLTSILEGIKIPDKYQNDIFLNNKIIFASKIHTSEKILHRFYRKIKHLNDTNFAKRNFTVPLTIKPKIKIELYSYLKEKFPDYHIKDPNIFYVGELSYEKLLSLYKRSKYFLHLAWLDHCPNVVVDARASGCNIICSSAGGTREIAGVNATIIQEDEWDFEPVELYSPPGLDFNKKTENVWNKLEDVSMHNVAKRYQKFLMEVVGS